MFTYKELFIKWNLDFEALVEVYHSLGWTASTDNIAWLELAETCDYLWENQRCTD